MAPWGYAQLQVVAQAIEGTKSIEDKKLADYLRANTFKTVVGDVKFGKAGEWAQGRVLQVQFHGVNKGNGVEQFRATNTQTVVTPAEYKAADLVYPYEKAKPDPTTRRTPSGPALTRMAATEHPDRP